MSTEDNKDVVRRSVEAINKGDLDTFDQLAGGPEEWKRRVANLLTAFPDVQLIQEDLIAEGDQVVERWTIRGSHKGTFMGIPPTGKYITYTGIDIFRIVDGQLVLIGQSVDRLGMLQQLGVIPAPG
jgi:predicted ester cyclase